MSQSKLTPGPWINRHWGRNNTIEIGAAVFTSDESEPALCRVRPRYSGNCVSGEAIAECEANARLIAAAPDLLADLQRINTLAEYVGHGTNETLRTIAAIASEAIAKATGTT